MDKIENENIDTNTETKTEDNLENTNSEDNPNNENLSSEIYIPKDIPEGMVGKTNQETIDNILKAYKGARKDLGKKSGVPEKFEDYKIDVPEEIANKVFKLGEDGKDPLFQAMLPKFHEAGMSQDSVIAVLSGLGEYLETISQESHNPEISGDINYEALGGVEKAQPEIDGARVWLDGLKNSGKLSEAAKNELELLTFHSQGLALIRELRPLLGDKLIPPSSNESPHSSDVDTEESLNARVADPRYHRGTRQFSQAFYDDTVARFEKFYNQKKS